MPQVIESSARRSPEPGARDGGLDLAEGGEAIDELVAVALDIADGLVQAFRAVSNPEKLQHLRRSAETQPFGG